MEKKALKILLSSVIMLLLTISFASAQTGTVKGKVVAANNGDPLPGTNVVAPAYNIGTAADIEGNFTVRNVPAGEVKLKATFIGYQPKTVQVEVKAGEIVQKNIKLKSQSIEGQEVEVMAQAKGQMDAINEQITSNTITDNVSSSRIRALPDANAAESVGRLPGVSIKRTGGEGNKVGIRGMSPKYTKITIEGTQMASTSSENRSVDLSMISSNLLAGIEVQKSLTASQVGDAMGGVVNFKVRDATSGLNSEILVEGGYTGLRNKLGDYKIMGSIDNRYFDDKLGLLLQISNERKSLDAENLTAEYEKQRGSLDEEMDSASVTRVDLEDVYRNRIRQGGAFVADYETDYSKVKLTNFINIGKTNTRNYNRVFMDNGSEKFMTNYDEQELFTMVNSLNWDQTLPRGDLNLKVSRSQSKRDVPVGGSFSFRNNSGLENPANKYTPTNLINESKETFKNVFLHEIPIDISNNDEIIWSYSGNYNYSYSLSNNISGDLEIGGMYREKYREYDENHYYVNANWGSASYVRNYLISYHGLQDEIDIGTENIPIKPFLSDDYDNENFLEGKYNMRNYADIDMVKETVKKLSNYDVPDSLDDKDRLRPQDVQSNTHDYSGNEYYTAAYIETNMKIGEKINVTPGLRYERNVTKYTGIRGDETEGASVNRDWSGAYYEATSKRTNQFFLPVLQIKVAPQDWWDVRLGYTESLSRPDYNSIIPRVLISDNNIAMGNVNLEPSHSNNYDLRLSFHSDRLGLLSVGGFYKNISNQIFSDQIVIRNKEHAEKFDGIPLEGNDYNETIDKNKVSTVVNNDNISEVYGFELSIQNQFWYLPGILGGLVFNGNYTYIDSEAQYPFAKIGTDYFTGEQYVDIDTTYKERLIDQPEHKLNLSLGMDYKGFSGRLSAKYKSNVFSRNAYWPELRGQTDDFMRWDLSLKQQLPIEGLECRLNIENLNNESDRSILKYNGLPTAERNYGRYISFTLNYKM